MKGLIVLLFFVCGSFASRTWDNEEVGDPMEPPVFSSTYITKAIMFIPYAEIEEPFTAYYDEKAGASRIDYYGEMVKTYQIMVNESYGEMMKIAPITTETRYLKLIVALEKKESSTYTTRVSQSLNVKTCLKIGGTTEMGPIKPQSALPDITKFKFVGKEIIEGTEAEKWQLVEAFGDVQNKYTMYLTHSASTSDPSVQIPVPVKFVMKGVNSVFGSHYDHYYIEYDGFSDEKPDPSVFEVKDMQCYPFPGPGADHVYTFNPMMEFIQTGVDHTDSRFEKFKKHHNKKYRNKSEHAKRKHVFKHNLRFIDSHNRAHKGYTLTANHLADLTKAELRAFLGRRFTTNDNGASSFPYDVKKEMQDMAPIPESFDWRLYGAVTPVKDQSVCGSCWSFGTTGTVEGTYFVHSGTLLRLSQQALIDCSWGYGNNGCDGGEDFRSYEWIMKHGGLPTEDDYGPYYGQDSYCHVANTTLVAPVKGFVNVTSGDENALKIALLKNGPISVAIYASLKTFSFYHNGVYYDKDCLHELDQLNHAVLLVGYGRMYGENYWLVKNSWSNRWGNDGYILMSVKNNNCGVMTTPTYPTYK